MKTKTKKKTTAAKPKTVKLDKKTILEANFDAKCVAIRRKAAWLKDALDDAERVQAKLVEGMQAVSAAASTLRIALSHFELAQSRSLALLTITVNGIERSQRVELHRGESRRIVLGPVEHEGMADIQLQNLTPQLCFMTQAIYVGTMFSKGSFIRAAVSVAAGAQIEVTVERP